MKLFSSCEKISKGAGGVDGLSLWCMLTIQFMCLEFGVMSGEIDRTHYMLLPLELEHIVSQSYYTIRLNVLLCDETVVDDTSNTHERAEVVCMQPCMQEPGA